MRWSYLVKIEKVWNEILRKIRQRPLREMVEKVVTCNLSQPNLVQNGNLASYMKTHHWNAYLLVESLERPAEKLGERQSRLLSQTKVCLVYMFKN